MSSKPSSLFDKVWDSHVVRSIPDGPDVLLIDRHFIHEVTSPVAFLGLKNRGLSVLYPHRTFATADHNTPTINQHLPVADPLSANQLKEMIDKTIYSVSNDETRHYLNGVFFELNTQTGFKMVATDGHRMSLVNKNIQDVKSSIFNT